MTKGILAAILLLAACGSAEETGASTTTIETPSTSSEMTATTSSTATTVGDTTTTGGSTTTIGSTTTSAPLAGNWADEPLIVTDFGGLGWWDGSDWVRVQDTGALPVEGGEHYQASLLGEGSVITGGPQTQLCDTALNLGVELEDRERLGVWPGPYGVAVSAGWSLHPHLFESFDDDDGSYAGFARDLLSERGLEVDEPNVKQLYRTDLEGDGTNEVLVVAEEVSPGLFAQEGDYSIIFLRKVIQGEVQTAVLGESVITEPDGFLLSFTIGTVADLSGDGKMEIVVDSAYYEGLGVEVWEYVDDDLGFVPRVNVACGA